MEQRDVTAHDHVGRFGLPVTVQFVKGGWDMPYVDPRQVLVLERKLQVAGYVVIEGTGGAHLRRHVWRFDPPERVRPDADASVLQHPPFAADLGQGSAQFLLGLTIRIFAQDTDYSIRQRSDKRGVRVSIVITESLG